LITQKIGLPICELKQAGFARQFFVSKKELALNLIGSEITNSKVSFKRKAKKAVNLALV